MLFAKWVRRVLLSWTISTKDTLEGKCPGYGRTNLVGQADGLSVKHTADPTQGHAPEEEQRGPKRGEAGRSGEKHGAVASADSACPAPHGDPYRLCSPCWCAGEAGVGESPSEDGSQAVSPKWADIARHFICVTSLTSPETKMW